jgi:hypothetical protein
MTIKTTLPTDSAARKRFPMARGPLAYAPAALAGVAQVCIDGNDKHNPGEPLHHARGKSSDHADCIVRHLMDVQDLLAAIERGDSPLPGRAGDGQHPLFVELNQLAWRALMLSQELHEKYGGAPLAPGARLPVAEPKPGTVTEVCGNVNSGSVCQKRPGHGGRHVDGCYAW